MIATGQFTIIDYNDALTLTGFISSNHAKTQIFNPDSSSFNPDWERDNLILTPSLYKLGMTNDLITDVQVENVKWYQLENGHETPVVVGDDFSVSGVKNHILTIKKNILERIPAKDFVCIISFRDAATNLDLMHKLSISFSKVINGGGITSAICWAEDGNVFKNDKVKTLTGTCDLWRGSVVDTTSVSYQWYKQDSSVLDDEGGGIGWKKLTSVSNFGCKNYTTRKITIPSSAVSSFAVFKCGVTDNDSSSSTYRKVFYDTISYVDNSDPLQISILSTGGDVFKNGQGNTTLNARIFRNGEEVDVEGSIYNYKWYKYNKEGVLDANFGGVGISNKSGKAIVVGSDDVDIKATFQVEIYKK